MSVETIHMPLLGEGTDVWVPIQAERVEEGRVRVLGPMPDDQVWSFPPGAIVTVSAKTFSDGTTGMVAVANFSDLTGG